MKRNPQHTAFTNLFEQFDIDFDPVEVYKSMFRNNDKAIIRYSVDDNEEDIVYTLALPGYTKDELNVDVKDNALIIECDIDADSETRWKKGFSRSITLSEKVNESKIKAEFKDGLLVINIPKKKPSVKSVKID